MHVLNQGGLMTPYGVKHLSILVKRQAIPWINAGLLWIGLARTMQVKFVSANNLHKSLYLLISCANYGQYILYF